MSSAGSRPSYLQPEAASSDAARRGHEVCACRWNARRMRCACLRCRPSIADANRQAQPPRQMPGFSEVFDVRRRTCASHCRILGEGNALPRCPHGRTADAPGLVDHRGGITILRPRITLSSVMRLALMIEAIGTRYFALRPESVSPLTTVWIVAGA